MIVDIEVKPGGLSISHINKTGDIEFLQVPLHKEERFVWEACSPNDKERDTTFTTWDNKPVKKVAADMYKKKFNKYRVGEVLAQRSDEVAILNEFNIPKKYVVDIEVEVTDGFPQPDTALNPVTAIGITNCTNKKIFVFGLKELNDEQAIKIEQDINKHFEKMGDRWTFQYIKKDNEVDMLKEFFEKLLPKFPCITGWNIIEYDWKYLLNRAIRLNNYLQGDKKIRVEDCSPAKRLQGKSRMPVHKLIIDYMEIYKKWDKVVKVKENNKLDYVGLQAVGIQKVKYAGSFKDLYEKDFAQFIFYNAVDCALVHYIDKKLNTMLTFLKLAHISGVEVNSAFSPIRIMEALMGREFLKMNKVFIYDDSKAEAPSIQFDGAYVKNPLVGLHDWVVCLDFASLYPSIMRQFNISPETFIGNNVEPKAGEIKAGEHTKPDGTQVWRVFNNDHDSIMRGILDRFYGARKTTKNKYLAVNKEIDFLKQAMKEKV